jgi:hypothetical protein
LLLLLMLLLLMMLLRVVGLLHLCLPQRLLLLLELQELRLQRCGGMRRRRALIFVSGGLVKILFLSFSLLVSLFSSLFLSPLAAVVTVVVGGGVVDGGTGGGAGNAAAGDGVGRRRGAGGSGGGGERSGARDWRRRQAAQSDRGEVQVRQARERTQ